MADGPPIWFLKSLGALLVVLLAACVVAIVSRTIDDMGVRFSKAPAGSCAELADQCRARNGRIYVDRMGSATCDITRSERLP